MKIFALELIKESLNAEQIQFVPTRKGYMFRLARTVGPFIVNVKQAFRKVEEMLKEFNF